MSASRIRTLVFVRHGETELNRDGDRFCGSLDPHLLEIGRQQAIRAARILPRIAPGVDAAWTSPSHRARETADLLLRGADWRVMEELRELSFGRWEGLTKDECRALTPEAFAAWERDPYHNAPPGGESGQQAQTRIEAIFDAVARDSGETIFMVSHKTLLRLLVGLAIGVPATEVRGSLELQSGKIGVLELCGQRGKLKALNL